MALGRDPDPFEAGGDASYFFWSIEAPQHFNWPPPPLVTMTCEPHFPQM